MLESKPFAYINQQHRSIHIYLDSGKKSLPKFGLYKDINGKTAAKIVILNYNIHCAVLMPTS